MKRSKTIFITAFHSFVSKNILNTDVLKTVASNNDLQIVILVPDIKESFFKNLYERNNILVKGVPIRSMTNRKQTRLFSAWSHLLIDSSYLRYKRHERLNIHRNIRTYTKFVVEIFLTKLFIWNPIVRWLIRKTFLSLVKFQEVKEIFDTYKPDVVFSTDVFDEADCLVAVETKRRGIKLISMVRSWDNCYSKGLMRVIPNKLIVNNEAIKLEAISMHRVPSEDIVVLGSPQYDVFIKKERTPREEFFRSMGLDPDKKLVLYAPAGAILSDTDSDIINILNKALSHNKFGTLVQFLVRNHPNHPADLKFASNWPGFVIEDPGKTFNNNPKDTELTMSDNEHLADEVFYADVVVWVATTLPLDAVVFDRPLISIDFDGFKHKKYYDSVRKYHDEDHMKKMLDLGGVSISKNPKELIFMINRYLENHLLDSDGRAKIRAQQFYKLDGNAGKRIGEYMVSQINS